MCALSVCERTLRSLQWSGFCLVSNSFEFSKFSSFSHTLFSQAFIWEGMASISGQRSLNPKSIDCLHKIPFGHSSTDQIFCLVFFVTLWSLIQHSASKATDHQIYILWDLFDLDNKTLLFFLLLFIGHPCLKAFPLCVCVWFNWDSMALTLPVRRCRCCFFSIQLLTLNEARTKGV